MRSVLVGFAVLISGAHALAGAPVDSAKFKSEAMAKWRDYVERCERLQVKCERYHTHRNGDEDEWARRTFELRSKQGHVSWWVLAQDFNQASPEFFCSVGNPSYSFRVMRTGPAAGWQITHQTPKPPDENSGVPEFPAFPTKRSLRITRSDGVVVAGFDHDSFLLPEILDDPKVKWSVTRDGNQLHLALKWDGPAPRPDNSPFTYANVRLDAATYLINGYDLETDVVNRGKAPCVCAKTYGTLKGLPVVTNSTTTYQGIDYYAKKPCSGKVTLDYTYTDDVPPDSLFQLTNFELGAAAEQLEAELAPASEPFPYHLVVVGAGCLFLAAAFALFRRSRRRAAAA